MAGGVGGHAGGQGGLPRRSDEKRGYPAPPETTGPVATRQAPPFLPSERQVFHTDSRDFKDQGFEEVLALPRKRGSFWKRRKRQQMLHWDQQSLRSCGKLTEPSQSSGKKPQSQAGTVF